MRTIKGIFQYGLTIKMSKEELIRKISVNNRTSFNSITILFLKEIIDKIINIKICKTIQLSGNTYVSLLEEVGFKYVIPSHSGGIVAAKLFEQYSGKERPKDLATIDELIKR
ncbi:MAG TPA: hypothetical protein VK071_12195 [Tissierellales bacterium]|nr:hypothetical protein [Tissierellales bacterium]